LPGNLTPGAWYHFGEFNDQRFTADGLFDRRSERVGRCRQARPKLGIFAVIEQTLYRAASVTEKGVSASLPGITAFARIAYSPPDRN